MKDLRSRWAARLGAICALVPLWGGLVGCLASRPRPVVRGPLASRTQHPLGLTFLAMRPRRARTLEAGRQGVGVQTSYTSLFEANRSGGDRVVFDGELARSSVNLRRGLTAGLDVEVELGLLYGTGGFLDAFLEGFHGMFFLPDGGRSIAPRDQFDMRIDRDGESVYRLEDHRLGWTDTPLILTAALAREEPGSWTPGVALRFGAELPTGSEDRGFGNGGVDFGAGLLLEKSSGRWTWTAAVDAIAPETSEAFAAANIHIRDFLQVQGGAEFRWNDSCSLLAQFFVTTPYTRDIDLEEINREIADLGLGMAFDVTPDSRLVISFHEDIVAATGPDFSLRLGWDWGF